MGNRSIGARIVSSSVLGLPALPARVKLGDELNARWVAGVLALLVSGGMAVVIGGFARGWTFGLRWLVVWLVLTWLALLVRAPTGRAKGFVVLVGALVVALGRYGLHRTGH